MWELTKSFRFEAAHSLPGTSFGVAGEEIHGHSFRAEVAIRGVPNPDTGMMVDLGAIEQSLAAIQRSLDHKFLNRVEGLAAPTLECLAQYIWDRVQTKAHLSRVTVFRDSRNESCSYFGPAR
jgi:6-pyruvoyltetrahydropterin/6-carboxytetrahydropterin synthase